jgi:phage terminase small subunit
LRGFLHLGENNVVTRSNNGVAQAERGERMLTEKQEKFVLNVLSGMSNIDAYKDSYDCENMSDNAISVEASRLLQNPKISLRLKELREDVAKPTILSAQERLEYLTRIINGEEKEKVFFINGDVEIAYEKPVEINTKLKAVDLMNKMTGEYVTKVEGNMNVKLEDLL